MTDKDPKTITPLPKEKKDEEPAPKGIIDRIYNWLSELIVAKEET